MNLKADILVPKRELDWACDITFCDKNRRCNIPILFGMRAMKRKISNRTGSGLPNPREDKVQHIGGPQRQADAL
jgi:hypothetical protein